MYGTRNHIVIISATWLALLIALSAVGFWTIFNTFLWYDDEGYVMITLKGILEGNALYTAVYTQYGPFFFQLHEAVYRLLPIELTHDTNRLLALIGWLFCSGIAAALMYEIHRSRAVAIATLLLVFFYLEVTVKEPGHPQQFCLMASLLGLWLFTRSQSSTALFFVGALVAMVGLTKVNLGAFLVIAAMASAASVARGQDRMLLGAAFSALLIAFAGYTLASAFKEATLSLLVTNLFAVTAILLTVKARICLPKMKLAAFVGGGALVVLLSLGVSIVQGSDSRDMYWSLVTQHATLASNRGFSYPLLAPIIAFMGVIAAFQFSSLDIDKSERALAQVKLAYGSIVLLIIIAGIVQSAPFRFTNGGQISGNANLIWWMAPGFAWLYCTSGRPETQLARIALAMTGTMLILGGFPISGSQLCFVTPFLLLVGIGVFHDSCAYMFSQSGGRSKFVTHALVACLSGMMLLGCALKASYAYQRYLGFGVDPGLRGATMLRLPEYEASPISSLVNYIKSECSAFVSINGINSLYFWTGQLPPTWWNQTVWPFYLTPQMQQHIISTMDDALRPCVIIYKGYGQYLNSVHLESPQGVFGRYVLDQYEVVWGNDMFLTLKKTKR